MTKAAQVRKVAGATLAGLVMMFACLGGPETSGPDIDLRGSSGDGGTESKGGDGGVVVTDSGDGGVSRGDGGTFADAGTQPDAGGAAISFPTAQDWTFWGPQHGGPSDVLSVSADDGGNLWVAGGSEGLFVLTPGASTMRRFTVAEGLAGYINESGVQGFKVISVRGAEAGVVYVGYEGIHGGKDDNDPDYMRKSGDADKVTLKPGGIVAEHIDISTPAGMYPNNEYLKNGRDKIRDVLRIERNAATGDIWFGGNHGIAFYDAVRKTLYEHEHADINGYIESPKGSGNLVYTLLSGDWYGVSLTPMGDLWMGGGHRIAKFPFGTSNRYPWANFTKIDVWPDAVQDNAYPKDRTDDMVQDMAAMPDESVWIGSITNGLAHYSATGTRFVSAANLVDPKVTALERDPANGTLWIGHQYGGITRMEGDTFHHYNFRVFGSTLIASPVWDIQNATLDGKRCILVAFRAGAAGVYCGP